MSTTTMMSNHHRRFVTPVGVGPPSNNTTNNNNNKKRKAFEAQPNKPPHTFKRPAQRPSSILRPGPSTTNNNNPKPPEPGQNNQLLAGYLAHEFITKGTLFGEPWDPARAEPADPVVIKKAEPLSKEKYERYVEVADLLKTDGARLPGVVNPTQLARILHL